MLFIMCSLAPVGEGVQEADASGRLGRMIQYATNAKCLQPSTTPLPAELRNYEADYRILPDQTIVFWIAKASAPSNEISLDSFVFEPFRGNPTTPSYRLHTPFQRGCYCVAVGYVQSCQASMTAFPESHAVFMLNVREYVKGTNKDSVIYFGYDTTVPRWQNTRPPGAGTCVAVVGSLQCRADDGLLCFNLLTISLNIGGKKDPGRGGVAPPTPQSGAGPSSGGTGYDEWADFGGSGANRGSGSRAGGGNAASSSQHPSSFVPPPQYPGHGYQSQTDPFVSASADEETDDVELATPPSNQLALQGKQKEVRNRKQANAQTVNPNQTTPPASEWVKTPPKHSRALEDDVDTMVDAASSSPSVPVANAASAKRRVRTKHI